MLTKDLPKNSKEANNNVYIFFKLVLVPYVYAFLHNIMPPTKIITIVNSQSKMLTNKKKGAISILNLSSLMRYHFI